MIDITLEATPREGTGKGPNRRLRVQDRVPAVLYGHGIDQAHTVSVDPKEMLKVLRTAWGQNVLLTLNVGGRSHKVMCREVQRDPVSRKIRHVDFVSPNPEKDVTVWVPLNVTGRSVGVQAGGKLRQPYREIRLKTRPALIPAAVDVDITPLDIGQGIMASDLRLGEGVTVVYDRDFAVAQIVASKKVEETR